MPDFLRRAMFESVRPHFFVDEYHFATGGPVGVRASIPALEIPAEPTPEPESASVVMLRALLAERRAERDRVEQARKSRVAQAEDAEKRAADLRSRIATDEHVLSVADAAIADVLDDIEKLGGRPENEK